MNQRDRDLAAQAWTENDWEGHVDLGKFADLIRADERDKVIGFIQDYPYWLGNTAKQELISAIRARGNT